MSKESITHEEIYLKSVHNILEREIACDGLLDLHTYLYYKDFESCPICNKWLIMRTKPEATT